MDRQKEGFESRFKSRNTGQGPAGELYRNTNRGEKNTQKQPFRGHRKGRNPKGPYGDSRTYVDKLGGTKLGREQGDKRSFLGHGRFESASETH